MRRLSQVRAPGLRPRTGASPLAVVVITAQAMLVGACSSHDEGPSDASPDYFGVTTPPGDGAPADGGSDAAPSATATMRLAHMVPDLGPLDFCWRASGSATFTGPMLHAALDAGPDAGDASLDGSPTDADADAGDDAAGLADAGADATVDADAANGAADAAPADAAIDAAPVDAAAPDGGGTPALDFGEITPDETLPGGGTFDLALVAAGASTCAQPLVVQAVTLDAGKRATVVAMGLAARDAGSSAALSLAAFTDDVAIDPAHARVRMIHAALGAPDGSAGAPPLEVSLVAGSAAIPVAAELDPRRATTPSAQDPSVDALGYAALDPIASPAAIRLTAVGDAGAGATWTTALVGDLDTGAGTVHSAFVVSRPAGALGVVWCGENTTSGPAVTCRLLQAVH
jgi:hypothetical protein